MRTIITAFALALAGARGYVVPDMSGKDAAKGHPGEAHRVHAAKYAAAAEEAARRGASVAAYRRNVQKEHHVAAAQMAPVSEEGEQGTNGEGGSLKGAVKTGAKKTTTYIGNRFKKNNNEETADVTEIHQTDVIHQTADENTDADPSSGPQSEVYENKLDEVNARLDAVTHACHKCEDAESELTDVLKEAVHIHTVAEQAAEKTAAKQAALLAATNEYDHKVEEYEENMNVGCKDLTPESREDTFEEVADQIKRLKELSQDAKHLKAEKVKAAMEVAVAEHDQEDADRSATNVDSHVAHLQEAREVACVGVPGNGPPPNTGDGSGK